MALLEYQIPLFDTTDLTTGEILPLYDLPKNIQFVEDPEFMKRAADRLRMGLPEATRYYLSPLLLGKKNPYIVVAYHFGGITYAQNGEADHGWILFESESADDVIKSAEELNKHPYVVLPSILDSENGNREAIPETYDGQTVAKYVPYHTDSLRPIDFK